MRQVIYLIFITAFSLEAFGRALNLSEEKFSSFFSVQSGTLVVGTAPFDGLVNGVDTYSSDFKASYGGEFGFIYASPYLAWKFAFAIQKPSVLKDVVGSASGVDTYTVSSDLTAVAPILGLQLNLQRRPDKRVFLFGFYGQSSLTLINTYSSTVTPYADHVEELKSSAPVYGGGLGYEFSFVDTTTIAIELGFRTLKFTNISYSKAVTSFQGDQAVGSSYLNYNGEAKEINMSGSFASIGFRFWL